ncbi:hypothetical protein DICA4_E09186 [Diutina catenulata]
MIRQFLRHNSSKDNSALINRFKQIADEKLQASANPSLINQDPTLNKIYNKYSAHPEAAAYIKSEPLLHTNPHAKQLAQSEPWRGTESVPDAALRMVVDSAPKPKKSPGNRLHDAREASLDYKLNPESKQFREMYRERLLGPSMFTSAPSAGVDLIGAVAGAKINASINQQTGKFDDVAVDGVRGKPLDRDHLKNCTDTNYFMNRILDNQQVLPPWVEAQQGLGGATEALKRDIDVRWFKWFINESAIATQIHLKSSTLFGCTELFKANFSTRVILTMPERDRAYIGARCNELNSKIRSYNLQCPSSHQHKFKLDARKEMNASYLRVVEKFPELLAAWWEQNKATRSRPVPVPPNNNGAGGLLNLFGEERGSKGAKETTIEVPVKDYDNKLGLWNAIKNVFK